MKHPNDELISLALAVVEVLDKKAKAGQQNPNGVSVGLAIENLINQAKRIIQIHNSY